MRSKLGAFGCLVVVAGVIAGAGSSSSSSSSSSTPGVTATSITIGSHQPLTGVAAPGYSEIAPAANAYFKYVNNRGGVFGRKINFIYKDDGYNPTNTVTVVRQLVLQDNVFAIFDGLGTPTHTKVVGFLNSSHVPDLFVASGCPCWDNGSTQPYTFGWLPNYTIEGKILGQYIKQHFRRQEGRRSLPERRLRQRRPRRSQGRASPRTRLSPPSRIEPTNTVIAPQVTAIQQPAHRCRSTSPCRRSRRSDS